MVYRVEYNCTLSDPVYGEHLAGRHAFVDANNAQEALSKVQSLLHVRGLRVIRAKRRNINNVTQSDAEYIIAGFVGKIPAKLLEKAKGENEP